jgi:hypothetical protein
MKMMEDIDGELKREEDDVSLGRKRGQTEEEREERRKKKQAAELMFVLATVAEQKFQEIARGEN